MNIKLFLCSMLVCLNAIGLEGKDYNIENVHIGDNAIDKNDEYKEKKWKRYIRKHKKEAVIIAGIGLGCVGLWLCKNWNMRNGASNTDTRSNGDEIDLRQKVRSRCKEQFEQDIDRLISEKTKQRREKIKKDIEIMKGYCIAKISYLEKDYCCEMPVFENELKAQGFIEWLGGDENVRKILQNYILWQVLGLGDKVEKVTITYRKDLFLLGGQKIEETIEGIVQVEWIC